MNKVTEIANKRIEAIRSEIRRMLDDITESLNNSFNHTVTSVRFM